MNDSDKTTFPLGECKEFCYCPSCNYEVPYEIDCPCFTQVCPSCGKKLSKKIKL